jgi:hypothetical protein
MVLSIFQPQGVFPCPGTFYINPEMLLSAFATFACIFYADSDRFNSSLRSYLSINPALIIKSVFFICLYSYIRPGCCSDAFMSGRFAVHTVRSAPQRTCHHAQRFVRGCTEMRFARKLGETSSGRPGAGGSWASTSQAAATRGTRVSARTMHPRPPRRPAPFDEQRDGLCRGKIPYLKPAV